MNVFVAHRARGNEVEGDIREHRVAHEIQSAAVLRHWRAVGGSICGVHSCGYNAAWPGRERRLLSVLGRTAYCPADALATVSPRIAEDPRTNTAPPLEYTPLAELATVTFSIEALPFTKRAPPFPTSPASESRMATSRRAAFALK